MTVLLGAACERWHFAGFSKAQEARKARFTRLQWLEGLARALPLSLVRRHLLIKDVKVFLRDVSQWSQLLLLLALVLVYLYNFRVLDLERIPYMSGIVKNVYALINLGMAGFVMATIAVRFVFPAVSAEGAAFWIVRTAPISLGDFLWSKFWTGLVPVLVLTETLTVLANQLLGIDPFLKVASAVAILFMSLALVGLATGLGARYPRFNAENPTQVAGSYGGVMFMILAVLFVIIACVLVGWPSSLYLWHRARGVSLSSSQQWTVWLSFASGCRAQPGDVVVVDAIGRAGSGRDGVRVGGRSDRVDQALPLWCFVKEGRAAHPRALADQVLPHQLGFHGQLRGGKRDAERFGQRVFRGGQVALHFEAQPAVADVHDPRRRVVDADRQAANHGLAFPAARHPE